MEVATAGGVVGTTGAAVGAAGGVVGTTGAAVGAAGVGGTGRGVGIATGVGDGTAVGEGCGVGDGMGDGVGIGVAVSGTGLPSPRNSSTEVLGGAPVPGGGFWPTTRPPSHPKALLHFGG